MRQSFANSPSSDLDLRLTREALRLRLSMLLINDLVKQQRFRVPIHLALGHEAIAVAVSDIMKAEDRLLLTHRNIHYNLARNPLLRREIDEYRLMKDGLGGGRFGAMNLINPAGGVLYTSSILGNCLPVASGVAKGLAVKARPGLVIAVTGDGAMEEGAFYEALMLARSLSLPVMFLVENNQWSMYTRIEERRCPVDLKAMAAVFAIPYMGLETGDVAEYRARLEPMRQETIGRREPCIVEVALSTLGDRWVEDETRGRRHINYHHGGVDALDYHGDPIIENTDRDPLHILASRIPDDTWRSLVDETRTRLETERA